MIVLRFSIVFRLKIDLIVLLIFVSPRKQFEWVLSSFHNIKIRFDTAH